jgi:hypothetical protein
MRSSLIRYALVFALTLLVLPSCEGSNASSTDNRRPTNNNNTPNPHNNNNNDNPDFIDPNRPDPAQEEDPGAGPDENEVLTPAGWAQGTWRVGISNPGSPDDDDPVVSLDLFQDGDDPEITGSFAINPSFEGLGGATGDIKGTFSGGTLTVTFNPSADMDELYTVTANRSGDNMMSGKLTTASGAYDLNVTLERIVD